jgi:VRR-NUC domain
MDWGCGVELTRQNFAVNSTVYLTPYQDAPFDLHVGFELIGCTMSTTDTTIAKTRGIYHRHQSRIADFLQKLCDLSQQELSNLVYDSISNRLHFMILRKRKDPFIVQDIAKSRLLSLIAAGCGGRLLASIFRCLLFDYRHYSGGLPDLLLVRARHLESHSSEMYLEEWVSQIANSGLDDKSNILFDKDDEFLGCKKVADSRGRQSIALGQFSNSVASTLKHPANNLSSEMLNEKMLLEESGRNVVVECMMVEVKSSNDRLDPRQEDWLNVMDQHGNARVCKFEKQT